MSELLVVAIENTVQIEKNGEWQPLKVGQLLNQDDQIMFSKNAIIIVKDSQGTLQFFNTRDAPSPESGQADQPVYQEFEAMPVKALSFTESPESESVSILNIAIYLPSDYSSKAFSTNEEGDIVPLQAEFTVIATEQLSVDSGEELTYRNNVTKDTVPFEIVAQPTDDIELSVKDIVFEEIDQGMPVQPIYISEAVTIQVSDTDGSEAVTDVALMLTNLPKGATLVGSGHIVDQVSHGVINFSGTLEDFQTLQLILPPDFSTESSIESSVIQGTLGVATDENGYESQTFNIQVTPEGDLEVKVDSYIQYAETNTGKQTRSINLSQHMEATPTDTDYFESIQTITVEMRNLPGGSDFIVPNSAAPASDYQITVSDNGVIKFEGTLQAFKTLQLKLPGDYSTETPGDNYLGELMGTFAVSTNEGAEASENFQIHIQEEHDLSIKALKITVNETDEDGLLFPVPEGQETPMIEPSLQVALGGLENKISVTDSDGSEYLIKSQTYNGEDYEVAIRFTGLPTFQTNDDLGNPRDGGGPYNVAFNEGVFDQTTATWYGNVAMFPKLVMTLPPDWATGVENPIRGHIKAQTNEGGERTRNNALEITVKELADPAVANEEQRVLESALDQKIDAGEVATIRLTPEIKVTDIDFYSNSENNGPSGSEFIASVLVKGVPVGGSYGNIFLQQDPNVAPGILKFKGIEESDGQVTLNYFLLPTDDNPTPWENLQLAGFPEHFSGQLDLQFVVTTKEQGSGVTKVTTLDYPVTVIPTVDSAVYLTIGKNQYGGDGEAIDSANRFEAMFEGLTIVRMLGDTDGSEVFVPMTTYNGMEIHASAAIDPAKGELTGAVFESIEGSGDYYIYDISQVYFKPMYFKPTEHSSGDFELSVTVQAVDQSLDFTNNPLVPLPDLIRSQTVNGGGAGEDWISGGQGGNSLFGGEGADTFIVFDADLNLGAIDTIRDGDFNPAEDVLDLSNILSFDIEAEEVSHYIQLDFDGMDTTVTIDQMEYGDFEHNGQEVFVLQSVGLSNADLSQMISDGSIHIDSEVT